MTYLLDTQLLLWSASGEIEKVSPAAANIVADIANRLIFSAASLWEVAIKAGLNRPDFQTDPHLLRRGLLDNGYEELPIVSLHAVAVTHLPPIHKDPFDRLLVAQATVEGFTLLTSDEMIAKYPGPIQLV